MVIIIYNLLTPIFLVKKIMLAKVLIKSNIIKVVLQTFFFPFAAINIYLLHLGNKCIIYVCLYISWKFKSHKIFLCHISI